MKITTLIDHWEREKKSKRRMEKKSIHTIPFEQTKYGLNGLCGRQRSWEKKNEMIKMNLWSSSFINLQRISTKKWKQTVLSVIILCSKREIERGGRNREIDPNSCENHLSLSTFFKSLSHFSSYYLLVLYLLRMIIG